MTRSSSPIALGFMNKASDKVVADQLMSYVNDNGLNETFHSA